MPNRQIFKHTNKQTGNQMQEQTTNTTVGQTNKTKLTNQFRYISVKHSEEQT